MSWRVAAISAATRLYGLLLCLCPAERLGDPTEMRGVFREALGATWSQGGCWAASCWCVGAFADTLAFAARERALQLRDLLLPVSIVDRSKGSTRIGRTGTLFEALTRQMRDSARSLRRTPLVTTVAVTSIALAVGLAALTFAVVYGTVERPLPFPDGDRIYSVEMAALDTDRTVSFEALELLDFRRWQASFEGLEGYLQRRVTLQGTDGQGFGLRAGFVTAGALELLGTRPVLGRTFVSGEDFTTEIHHVVLGHDLWQRHFGGRRDVLGHTVRIDGRSLEVVGVMPAGFRFPTRESLWLPMDFDLPTDDRGSGRSFRVFGRLHPEASEGSATAEASRLAGRLAAENPDLFPPLTARLTPFARTHLPGGLDPLLRILLVAVAGILLIATANVVNLLLARAETSSREASIRTALGASRGELTGRFLVEALLLASAGAAVGTLLAAAGVTHIERVASQLALPFWVRIELDPPVLLATATAAASIALLGGGFAGWRTGRLRWDSLRGAGRGITSQSTGGIGRWLVGVQIALSCALLVGAGLLVKSAAQARSLDLGFDSARVMKADLRLPALAFPDPDTRSDFFDTFLARLEAVPGVEAAAWVRSAPGTGPTFAWTYEVLGEERPEPHGASADGVPVSRGYFDTLGIEQLQGRDFSTAESRFGGMRAVIVNRTLAERRLGSDPVGRQLRLGPDEPWLPVVGVVEDSYIGTSSGGFGLSQAPREQIFLAWGAAPYSRATLVVRSATADPLALAPSIRQLLAEMAPGVALEEVAGLRRVIDDSTWAFALFGSLFGFFGGTATVLSMIGLYGVSAFLVRRRYREMGVRLALGATPGGLLRLVLGAAARQLALGTAAGLLLGALLARSIRALLFGVGVADPAVYGTIALGLVLLGLWAAALSARPATRMAPSEVLSR